MTPKERAAMQQALEALEEYRDTQMILAPRKAITALREALGNSLKPKCFADYQPNHTIDRACASCAVAVECQTGEQAEQEPVGWYSHKGGFNECGEGQPLYAAPVRTKDHCNPLQDLTDDEIHKCMNGNFYNALDFARAVISADREKNK